MKYKLVVSDLDGTLLNSAKEVSNSDRRAIEALRESGIFFAIATGRSDLLTKRYLLELNITTPVIACNGSLIKDMRKDEIIHGQLIPLPMALAVIDYCDSKQWDYLVYTPEIVYYTEKSKRIEFIRDYNRSVAEDIQVPIRSISELLKHDKAEILKILIKKEEEQAVIRELDDKFNKDHELAMVSSGTGLIDVMTTDVSKGNATAVLAEYLGVDLTETVVLGDNYNDISMFKVAGLSIAMENAEEELKKMADIVTSSNDDSGFCDAVYRYILKENF